MAKSPLPPPPPPNRGAESALGAANALGKVVGGLQTIASFGGQPAAAIGAIGGQIGKVAGMMGPWGAAVGAFVSVGAQVPQLFKSAADSIAQLVGAYSPATVKMYQRAWADLTASIGQMLMPVMRACTAVVRYFADSIAGLRPVLQPIIDTLTDIYSKSYGGVGALIRETMNVFVTFGSAVMPIVTDSIRLLYTPMTWFADQLRQLAVWIRTGAQAIAMWLGLDWKEATGSSQMKAAVGTSTTTTTDMLRKMREQAFALGSSGKAEPDSAKTVNLLLRIYEWITKTLPTELTKAALDIYQNIVNALNLLPAAIGGSLKAALSALTGGESDRMMPFGDAVASAIAGHMRAVFTGNASFFGGL